MSLLKRIADAVLNEIRKPESFVKGDEFESFVRNHLYPKDDYELLHRTHDYTSNRNDYINTSKEPDFKFKSRKNGREFFVEVKYRSGFYNNEIKWCKHYQLKRYREIDKDIPVFVVIGVGELPRSPSHVYRIPLKDIRYTKLFHSFLKKYEISSN